MTLGKAIGAELPEALWVQAHSAMPRMQDAESKEIIFQVQK